MFFEGTNKNDDMKICYSELYLDDFTTAMSSVFLVTAQNGYDAFTVLDVFLSSIVFKEILERQNPMYLNMGYRQLFECISYDEGFDYKATKGKGVECDPYILEWCGWVLSKFFWKYSIDFNDWLKYFSVEDVYGYYYPANEASIDWTADLLMSNYKYAKERKEFREVTIFNKGLHFGPKSYED